MDRDSEPRATTGDTRPFIAIEAPGPLRGIVTLTALENGHGRTLVEAAWTQDGHRHRDSVEVATFADAHLLADKIAGELAACRAPDLGRVAAVRPSIETPEIEQRTASAAAPALFVLALLLAGLALILAGRRFRRRRRHQQAVNG